MVSEALSQKKNRESKHTAHTYSQEMIQSPVETKINPPAPPSRCEIGNSGNSAAVCRFNGKGKVLLGPTDDLRNNEESRSLHDQGC